MPSSQSPIEQKKSYRGILSMIMGPAKITSVPSSIESNHYSLWHYPLDKITPNAATANATANATLRLVKRSSSRRRRKPRDDLEANTKNGHQYTTLLPLKIFDPHQAEFTLLFFCDFDCRNSIRFLPILANFLNNCTNHTAQISNHDQVQALVKPCTSSSLMKSCCQLICVPNNEIPTELVKAHDEFMGFFTYLASHTEFWHLGYNHASRLFIIRLLGVSMVPTLVVLDNRTGKMITNSGMQAIEYNQHRNPEIVIESWRQGENSVPFLARVAMECVIA